MDTDFYFKVLDQLEEYNKKLITTKEVSSTIEGDLLKCLVFQSLIVHHNIPFRINEIQSDINNNHGLNIFSSNKEQESIKEIVIQNYKCSYDKLKEVMKDDFEKYITKETTSETDNNNENQPVFNEHFSLDFDDNPKPKKKKEKKIQETVKQETKPTGANRLPEFTINSSLPYDPKGKKHIDTLWYNKHTMVFEQDVINVYIYPLTIINQNEPITDIAVIAESEGIIRSAISRGLKKSVILEITTNGNHSYKFVMRGSWNNGNFKSSVNMMNNQYIEDEVIIEHPATQRTATTFASIKAANGYIFIFPAQIQNNGNNGLALATVVIKSNNDITLLNPTPEGNFVIGGNGQKQINLTTYWLGDNFIYDVINL